jgi:hypothetical protein
MLGLSRLANFEQITTDVGRQVAISNGWYNARRSFQSIGIYGIILGSSGIISFMLARFQHLRAPEALGIVSLCCLLTLIGVRLISLHSVDHIVGRHINGVQLGWLLELLFLVCIVGASFWRVLRPHSDSVS